jgi:hypothetical protein
MRKAYRAPTPDATAPDGVEIRYLVDELQGAQKLSLAEGAVGQNQRSHKVYHTTYEEIWYFLQGEGIFHLHAPGASAEGRPRWGLATRCSCRLHTGSGW